MAKPTDPWADKPDRFDRADDAWDARWADRPADDPDPDGLAWDDAASPDYHDRDATPGRVTDAYGDGMRAGGAHLGFGLQIGVSMAVFVGVGIAVDRWLGTTPWGVVVGAALGMVGVMTLVLRFAKESR